MEFHLREMIGKGIKEKGKVMVFGKGEMPRNYVSVEDVSDYVLMALEKPEARGRTIIAGGPENISPLQAISKYENILGKKTKVRHLPRFMLKTMSVALKPFHPGLSQIMAAAYYGDKNGEDLDISQTQREFPKDLLSVEEWIEKYDK